MNKWFRKKEPKITRVLMSDSQTVYRYDENQDVELKIRLNDKIDHIALCNEFCVIVTNDYRVYVHGNVQNRANNFVSKVEKDKLTICDKLMDYMRLNNTRVHSVNVASNMFSVVLAQFQTLYSFVETPCAKTLVNKSVLDCRKMYERLGNQTGNVIRLSSGCVFVLMVNAVTTTYYYCFAVFPCQGRTYESDANQAHMLFDGVGKTGTEFKSSFEIADLKVKVFVDARVRFGVRTCVDSARETEVFSGKHEMPKQCSDIFVYRDLICRNTTCYDALSPES